MLLNLFDQIVCPSPKVWDFNEKRLHWASVVRGGSTQMKNDEPLAICSIRDESRKGTILLYYVMTKEVVQRIHSISELGRVN